MAGRVGRMKRAIESPYGTMLWEMQHVRLLPGREGPFLEDEAGTLCNCSVGRALSLAHPCP